MKRSGKWGRDRGRAREGPEERVVVARAGRNGAAGEKASLERSARTDLGALPDDGAPEACPCSQCRIADHAPDRVGSGLIMRTIEENPGSRVERAGPGREWSAARERFERRAEEIAWAAEIGEESFVLDPPDFLPPFEEALPKVADERGLSGGDLSEQPGSEHADAGVQKGRDLPIGLTAGLPAAEARDAVPFGLKRRIPVGLSVCHDEQSRRPAALAMAAQESLVVGLDGRVGVDDEKVPGREKSGGVFHASRGAEKVALAEEVELREFRRVIDQVLLDLTAEMMEVDAGLGHAEPTEACEMSAGQRNVQEGEERLRNRFRDRPEADAASGRQQESADAGARRNDAAHGRSK